MPRRLWSASPSKLTTWLDCPRRFRLRYVERGVPGRVWAHQSLGASAHNALRDWWSLPTPERTPSAAVDLLRRDWIDEGYRDAAQSDRWRRTVAGWVSDYVATLDPDDDPVGVERTVATTTPGLALSGRIDRIDVRAVDGVDEAVVVDYKTSRRVPDEDDARTSLALATYVAGVRRTLRRPCRRVELHHLPSGSVAAWIHTDDSVARHLRRADEIGADARSAVDAWAARAESGPPADGPGAADDLFPPRPGPLCGWCDVRTSCPDGRAAAPAVPSWAGLAEADVPPEVGV